MWRILWIGRLRPSTANPVGYDIQVHLSWAGSGYKAPISRWVPLPNLIYLRPQSLWSNGLFQEHPAGINRTFNVIAHSGVSRPPWEISPTSLLQLDDYRFHGERELAPCLCFDTAEDEQLVVPSWEVLRAWYLFDHDVMPATLAGALRNIDALAYEFQPWLHPSGPTADGLQIVRPSRMSDAQMKRIARLVFDDIAFGRAYDIYRQLMLGHAMTGEGSASFDLPVVLPPYDGIGAWKVTCREISSVGGKKRWLVLSLNGATIPTPFTDLHIVDERDNRRGEDNYADPDLPTRSSRGQARVEGIDGDGLAQRAVRADEHIESVLIEGFDFEDNIVSDVRTIRRRKSLQASRVMHTPTEALIVEGAGIDPAGPKRSRHTRTTIEGSFTPLSADALLRRTIDVFNRLARASTGTRLGRRGIQARLVTNQGGETFQVRSKKTLAMRHFAILEVRHLDRFAYVMDAERRGSEGFSLFICRSTDRLRLSTSVFDAWLAKFPAKKISPWQGTEIMPPILYGESVVHQPHSPGSSIETGNFKLRIRLEKIIVAFV